MCRRLKRSSFSGSGLRRVHGGTRLNSPGGEVAALVATPPASLRPEKAVLVVAVGLPSLTFRKDNFSKTNLIASSFFGDGRVRGTGEDHKLLDSFSWTWPETERVMGWDVVEPGLKIVVNRHVSTIAREDPREHREGPLSFRSTSK